LKHKELFPTQDPATILVIDDDLAMRTIVSFSLAAFGYVVLAAKDGEEALRSAHDHPEIRLIMLDVVMSGLSGQKLAIQLKAIVPRASILFCSGHPATSMAQHNIDLEFEHFLQKPCRPPELKRKLEEMLTIGEPLVVASVSTDCNAL
jgi:two-component system cell cycle sensor histidine kinase/response regulator CckA